ncbi:zinc-ribbon domain-containing protein [Aeromonas jandaei]|nr:zinc-ribbon domain-containing protein [Aeromonas jandaei]
MKSLEDWKKEYEQDDFCGTEFKTPKGGVLTVVGIAGKDKHRIKMFACHCSICHQDEVMFPELETSHKAGLVRGKCPCACSKNYRWNDRQYRLRLRNDNYQVISQEEITGVLQKVKLRCNRDGYEWESRVNSVLGGVGCPKCADCDKRNGDPLSNILNRCSELSIKFHGFVDGVYKNNSTTLDLECRCGNKWNPSYASFVNGKRGCPACAKYGYQPTKSGVFYFTVWQKGDHRFIKYGIACDFDYRIHVHKRETDYELVYQWSPEYSDGNIPLEIEQACDEYRNKTVGKSGYMTKDEFLAYTETLPIAAYDDLCEIIAEHCIARPKPLEMIL